MTRARRWWLGALAAVVCLPPLAAALLLWLVDPDSLRPAIEREVRARFGIPLQLRGSLRWKLWPALGVESGEGALGEASQISWRALRFTLQWPGWRGTDWQFQGVQVDGLRLQLQPDAQGRWNVASSWTAANAAARGGDAVASATIDVHVDPLQLTDARIELLLDRAAAPWLIEVRRASARIDTAASFSHWTLRDVQLDANVGGVALASAQPLSVRTARIEYRDGGSVLQGRIDAEPLVVAWGRTELRWRPARSLTLTPLSAEGELELQGPSLREALTLHRIDVPPMRDATVLGRFTARGHGLLDEGTVSLTQLQARLDDTQWQGSVSGRWRTPASWRVDLAGDVLDVERYRRPAADPGEPFELPVAALRALPVAGTVRVRELRGAGSRARDVRIVLQ